MLGSLTQAPEGSFAHLDEASDNLDEHLHRQYRRTRRWPALPPLPKAIIADAEDGNECSEGRKSGGGIGIKIKGTA